MKDINALEGVQRFASRICSKQWCPQVEYPAMLESLHIPPLGSRRLKMKVCLLHRMIHGQSIYHDPPFDYRTATFASRSVNPLSLTRPFAKHNYTQHGAHAITCNLDAITNVVVRTARIHMEYD